MPKLFLPGDPPNLQRVELSESYTGTSEGIAFSQKGANALYALIDSQFDDAKAQLAETYPTAYQQFRIYPGSSDNARLSLKLAQDAFKHAPFVKYIGATHYIRCYANLITKSSTAPFAYAFGISCGVSEYEMINGLIDINQNGGFSTSLILVDFASLNARNMDITPSSTNPIEVWW